MGTLKKKTNCVKTSFLFSKVENIKTHSPLRAMFLILNHVDKGNSEYPENVDYPDLTKQKNISQHSRGAVSIHRINNLDR